MDIKCQYCEAELEADENCYGEICCCPICGEKINIPFPDDLPDNGPDNGPDNVDAWGAAPF